MLNIVQAPDPVLSKATKKINKVDSKIRKLINEMAVTLENTTDPEGVGLAAPQVGISLKLFIIKENPTSPLLTFINPEILSNSKDKYPLTENNKDSQINKSKRKKGVKLEGCLSLKDIWGVVNRASSLTLRFMDENGIIKEKVFSGFLATIIQHECDHLEGILFPKRVLEQKETLYKSTRDEKGEMVFEEIDL